MACTEPNDPRLPLIGCCDTRLRAELYFWSAGNDSLSAQSAFQPFEPANFMAIMAQGRSGHQISPIPIPNGPDQDLRYTFLFRGVWQAVPEGIWEILAGQALRDALPKRAAIDIFGRPREYYDYCIPVFLMAPKLPLIPLWNLCGVLINSIPGAGLADNASYRFDRVIDVWPTGIQPAGARDITHNLFLYGEFQSHFTINGISLLTIDDMDQFWQIERRNSGCSISDLDLPGMPSVMTPFGKGVNVSFLSTYSSTNRTPLIIRDNAPPARCG